VLSTKAREMLLQDASCPRPYPTSISTSCEADHQISKETLSGNLISICAQEPRLSYTKLPSPVRFFVSTGVRGARLILHDRSQLSIKRRAGKDLETAERHERKALAASKYSSSEDLISRACGKTPVGTCKNQACIE
jgi:hypothetical protein